MMALPKKIGKAIGNSHRHYYLEGNFFSTLSLAGLRLPQAASPIERPAEQIRVVRAVVTA
jgi:hypothetical protein